MHPPNFNIHSLESRDRPIMNLSIDEGYQVMETSYEVKSIIDANRVQIGGGYDSASAGRKVVRKGESSSFYYFES
ncbi:hypothetical protein BHYA_0092g00140 [Botrytis hyacinthi]|uniref:Uncharacterized protein n=1 Tax=Botrytis hyacinthi TaxID=278943 RepID=A0A4Z1GSA3_9HELO|nr:hypothetical protein BHYA_0092g00140 [Botrytis hyacinthi]